MTPFAALVTWSDPHPASPARLQAALDAVLPCCTEGRRLVSVPGATLAVGLKATMADETLANGLLVEERQQWAAVGDVTLYEREEVARRLGIGAGDQTDLSLLAHTFRQFGPAAVGQIAGDFALVIWDWRCRRLHAIRDHFGVRSLFYRRGKQGMEVAGSVAQLLAMDAGDRAIDDVMVYQYLTNTFVRSGHSFFAHITPLGPAAWLDAGTSHCRQLPYWQPSFAPVAATYDDLVDVWRHRFRAAVRDRIRSHRPVAAYLSGGFDSSSIVGAAHDVLAVGATSEGRPLSLSASFPGFACDEQPYIQAVLQRCTSFDSFVWDGREPNPDDFDDPDLSAPGLGQGIGRSPRRENRAMQARDCRVVLTGDGGDALGFGYGALADLVLHGRLITFAGELALLGSWQRIRSILGVEVAGMRFSRRRMAAPEWLAPDLYLLSSEYRADVSISQRTPSRIQQNTFTALTRPLSGYVVDTVVAAGARYGFQVRSPYLDVRLAECVLGISWRHRLPHGDLRRLQKDGVAPFVPVTVRTRRGKAGFDAMLPHQVRANLSRIEHLFGDRTWASERFVKQPAARARLHFLMRGGPRIPAAADWREVWRMAVLEAWLRRVFGYSAARCAELS